MKVFEDELIKQCVLITLKDRLWGAWQVLMGRAGIILLSIDPKKFYEGGRE